MTTTVKWLPIPPMLLLPCLWISLLLLMTGPADSAAENITANHSAKAESLSLQTTLPEIVPQAVQHQNGFVRVSESEYDHVHHIHGHPEHGDETPRPHLDGNTTGNVSMSEKVFLSKPATLDCKVYDVHEESVSWMRQVGDMLQLLSYDKNIYAADGRYELQYESGMSWKRWKLVIKSTEKNDSGLYRCQIDSKPSLVLDIVLNVTEPRTRIVDERGSDVVEKHYNSGSMIELKCLVDQVPLASDPVWWKKGAKLLFFNTSRGGISEKRDGSSGGITSRLYVVKASPRDSGVYSCWYGNLSFAIVTVHVIAGENSAAMQHDALLEDQVASTATTFLVVPKIFLSLSQLISVINFYSWFSQATITPLVLRIFNTAPPKLAFYTR